MVVAFLVYENAATICWGEGSGTPLDRANQVRIALDGHFVVYGKRFLFPVGLDCIEDPPFISAAPFALLSSCGSRACLWSAAIRGDLHRISAQVQQLRAGIFAKRCDTNKDSLVDLHRVSLTRPISSRVPIYTVISFYIQHFVSNEDPNGYTRISVLV